MKKITMILAVLLAAGLAVQAQPGSGFGRQTPEERSAAVIAKLDSAFKLEPAKQRTLDTALVALYKAQQEKMKEMLSSGDRPDRETLMTEMKKYSDARDEMIKMILTADQFVTWKEKIEPSMRPRMREGGRNGN